MREHAVEDTTPKRCFLSLIGGRNSNTDMIAAILIFLGQINEIEIKNIDLDIPMDNMDVNIKFFISYCSYKVFIVLTTIDLVRNEPFLLQLSLWVFGLAVQCNYWGFWGSYFNEEDTFLAWFFFYWFYFVYQLLSFLFILFEVVKTFLEILAPLAEFFLNKRKTLISGNFESKIIRSINLH